MSKRTKRRKNRGRTKPEKTPQPRGQDGALGLAGDPPSDERGRPRGYGYGYPRRPQRVVRLNHRLIILLFVATALLGVGMHFLHDFQVDRNADALLERADRAEADGKLGEAVNYLAQYTQFRPKDADALARLGNLVERQSYEPSSWRRALSTYESVLRLDADRPEIRRDLVEAAMRLGRYDRAMHHIQILIDGAPDDADLAYRAARCQTGLGKYAAAADSCVRAIQLDPDRRDPYLLLARLVRDHSDQVPLGSLDRQVVEWSGRDDAATDREAPAPEDSGSNKEPASDESREDEEENEESAQAAPARIVDADRLFDRILDVMVQRARPTVKALIARAQFRLREVNENVVRPAETDDPTARAARVLDGLDSDGDALLDRREWDRLPVRPALVDADGDGRINRSELEARYRGGPQRAALDSARRDLEAARDRAPDDPDLLHTSAILFLDRARLARQDGNAGEAEQALHQARADARRGLEVAPENVRFHLVLSRVAQEREGVAAALDRLQEGLQRLAEVRKKARKRTDRSEEEEARSPAFFEQLRREFLFRQTDLLVAQARSGDSRLDPQPLREAEASLEEFRESIGVPGAPRMQALARFLEGRILLARGQWREASLTFEEARPDLRDRPGLLRRLDLMLGGCYARLNNPDAQLRVYRRALREDPDWAEGRRQLAAALAEADRLEEALREYRSVSHLPGVPLRIARLLIQRRQQQPGGGPDWEAVQQALQAETNRDGGEASEPEAVRLQAQVLAAQNKFSEATALLEEALQRQPDQVSLWSVRAVLPMYRNDLEPAARLRRAQSILQEARETIGDRVELRLTAAQLALRQPAEKARLSLEELRSDLEEFSDAERARLFDGLADAYTRLGDRRQARHMWQRVAELEPENLEVRMVLARLAIQDGDEQAVQKHLQKLRAIEGSNGPNGNFIAALWQLRTITEQFDPPVEDERRRAELRAAAQRPRRLLEEAARQRPSWAEVARTRGDVEYLLGNRSVAAEHYQKAISLGDRSRRAISRLVSHLYQQQRFDEADQLLTQLGREDSSLLSGRLGRMASGVSFLRREYDEAINRISRQAAESGAVRDLILQGQLLFAQGDRGQEAEEAFRRAVQAARASEPDLIPAAYYQLVLYLARTGQIEGKDGAVATIREAAGNLPQEPPHLAPLTLARFHELLYWLRPDEDRFRDRAEEFYLQAVAARPEDVDLRMNLAGFFVRTTQTEKAQTQLDHILNPETDAPPEAVAWANRVKSYLMASGGDYADMLEALDHLERSAAGSGSGQSSLEDLRTKAVILAQSPLRRDRLKLIDVLEQIDRMQALSADDRYRLARLYEAVGHWEKAAETFETLLERHPDNGLFLAEYVEGLIERDRLGEAEGRLARLESLMPDSFSLVLLKAKLLHAREKTDEAVSLVRQFLADRDADPSPEQTVRDLLAQDRADEALQILQRHAGARENDDEAAQAIREGRNLLEEGRTEAAVKVLEEYLQREELQARIRRFYRRTAARFLSQLGRHAAAEDVFRRSMEQSDQPDDILTLVFYVARQGRIEEALDLCDRAWENEEIAASAVASTSVAVLRTAEQPAPEHVQRVEQRLAAELEKDPGGNLAVYLADLRDFQGRYGEAERLYMEILEQNGRNVMALNNLAWMWGLREKNPDQALEYINRAIAQTGPAAELLDTRAVVHLSRGDAQLAVKDLEQAIESSPSAVKYAHLARAYLEQGDRTAAQNAYRKARQEGFSLEDLHPLERDRYRPLTDRLAGRI